MRRRDFFGAALLGAAGLARSAGIDAAREAAADIPAVRLSGKATVLSRNGLNDLARRLRGTLILPAIRSTKKPGESGTP